MEEAKNKLEGYCFSVRSSMLDDAKMKTALGDEASTVEAAIKETLDWLEQEHTTEEYEAHQKELEGKLMPIIQKAYQANMPQQPAEGNQTGPSVADVD